MEVVGTGLNLDAWWDEPVYKAAQGTFSEKGTLILARLREHDAAKLQDVMVDLYRDAQPDRMDITKFQWATILAFMGANEEEIKDVQLRMGRVWR
jgi:hypothetical protein